MNQDSSRVFIACFPANDRVPETLVAGHFCSFCGVLGMLPCELTGFSHCLEHRKRIEPIQCR